MNYSDKFNSLKPFVNLKIPHNKKHFTPAEKGLITKYYNKAENLGIFNDREGYKTVDISRRDFKLKHAPRFKAIPVNVGTVQDKHGNVTTAKDVRITFKNNKVYTKRKDGAGRWQFYYSITKDYTQTEFKAYLLKQMGKKPSEGEYYAVGAGIYVIKGTYDYLGDIAKEVLRLHSKYSKIYEAARDKEDNGEELTRYENSVKNKKTSDWLNNVVVYEGKQSVIEYTRKKRKKKKDRRIKYGKKNRSN